MVMGVDGGDAYGDGVAAAAGRTRYGNGDVLMGRGTAVMCRDGPLVWGGCAAPE